MRNIILEYLDLKALKNKIIDTMKVATTLNL